MPKTVAFRILKEDLGKRKLCARFVLHSLTPEQREDRVMSIPQIEMKFEILHFVDVVEIQEAITDELKESPKRGIFQRLHRSLYIFHWCLF